MSTPSDETAEPAASAEGTGTAGAAPLAGTGGGRFPQTVAMLERGRREGRHLGAQVYVSRHGEPLADLAFGWAAEDVPLTPDHLMLWLSSTKPIAAVAVARLWEARALALDDPIRAHIPEFAAHDKGGITVRHALTHTGGFRMVDVGWPHESWDDIIAKICERKPEPRWVPGEKAGYHMTSSWFILGELVRRLDGRPFERYVRREVLEPLGMENSWIGMPAERFREYGARIAPMWNSTEGIEAGERKHRWDQEERVRRPSPGGNGRGPVRELGRFYEALLAGGARRGRRVLSPQTVEALTARHRVGMFDHTFQHLLDWGLGFIPDSKHYGPDTVPYAYGRLCSRRTFGHSGYRSSTGFADPVHGLAVAVAFNGTPDAAPHRERMQATLEAIYLDLGLGADDEPTGDDGSSGETAAGDRPGRAATGSTGQRG